MDEYDEQIRSMIGDGPSEAEEQARKKAMTTEEELREIVKSSEPGPETLEGCHKQDDHIIDLLIDLIAERSEEKALEVIDLHERDYDHNRLY